ncbi:MAG: glutamate 5-kinase [Parvibaculales bacterium]
MTKSVNTSAHSALKKAQRIVIKVGSALLMQDEHGNLRQDWMRAMAQDIAALQNLGKQVILVSSGAIALGRGELGLIQDSLTLEQSQAAAATGQIALAQAWREVLAEQGCRGAQILLTVDDTEQRRRYLNARGTLNTLLGLKVVPVINENDTVATQEIRYGDNDRLAARVAAMTSSDCLILLSDVDGLYADQNRIGEAEAHIAEVKQLDDEIYAMAGASKNRFSSGGMITKLEAARLATQAGAHMILADGRQDHALGGLIDGTSRCTFFQAHHSPHDARKSFIAGSLQNGSRVHIDAGAAKALHNGKSLLYIGVTQIEGQFERGACVAVICDGAEIARGLVEHSNSASQAFIGKQTDEIAAELDYYGRTELIHRDNLVLTHTQDDETGMGEQNDK